ncbi:hypothetical protein ACWIGI_06895 [Nocardia sp. NPDC055321]
MGALTQGPSRVTRVTLTSEQIAERRREAEKILKRKLARAASVLKTAK